MIIGIIGIRGTYGQWFTSFFEAKGHTVIGSGRTTPITNQDVIEQSDIVIFSMKPMRAVPEEMLRLAPFMKKESQLWVDITGLKDGVAKAAAKIKKIKSKKLGEKSAIDFFSFHPMFAPSGADWKGRNVIVTESPISQKWCVWADEFLAATGANVIECTPKEHDERIAMIQALPHALALVSASVLRGKKADQKKLLISSTPVYETLFSLMARVLSKNPELYAEIQMDNAAVKKVLDTLIKEMKSFKKIVAAKNSKKFVAEFLKNKEYFGEELLKEGDALFEQIHFGK